MLHALFLLLLLLECMLLPALLLLQHTNLSASGQ
jgi:hypothetical protein